MLLYYSKFLVVFNVKKVSLVYVLIFVIVDYITFIFMIAFMCLVLWR